MQRHYQYRLCDMPGSGKMICNACGLSTQMTGALTSHDPAATVRGYQCQDCGQIQRLKGDPLYPQCACGGSLTRTRYAFCPKCRSMDVTYNMRFIT
jgi:hypothetical protein